MPDIDIGEYELDEDSNGNLVIKDTNDNNILRWDSANATWTFDNNAIEGINSISTDSATIGNGSRIQQVDFGSFPGQTTPAAADGSFDTFGETTVNVTFSTDFPSPPTVVVTLEAGSGGTVAYVETVSKSGFEFDIRNFSTSELAPSGNWLAMG